MSAWWLLFIIPVSYLAGFFIAAILASSGRDEAESFWRNNYFMEKDSHSGTKKLLDEYKNKGATNETKRNK